MSTLDQLMNGDGFRFYRYTDDAGLVTDLLSVTSIRSLCGESYNLVNWKMANLADAALGTQKRTVIGPRGGVKEVRQVFEFPSEFARLYGESGGEQGKVDALRKWLRERGDEPRNIAANRGSIVHEAIEKSVRWDRIERPYVEDAFTRLSASDRKRSGAITDEDVYFVRHSMRQFWDMREAVPMVLLAREVRVLNITVGYAGTFDTLAWLLGDIADDGSFVPLPQEKRVEAGSIGPNATAADVARIGGFIALLDWKTATDIHSDNVVQAHAYLAAEFAVRDGVRDERLTDLVKGAMVGGLVHIRPNKWALDLFRWDPAVIRAFFGSVAFARFLAAYPKPDKLFSAVLSGSAGEVE